MAPADIEASREARLKEFIYRLLGLVVVFSALPIQHAFEAWWTKSGFTFRGTSTGRRRLI